MSRNRNEHDHPLLISTLGAVGCLLLANVRVQSRDDWGRPRLRGREHAIRRPGDQAGR